MVYEQLHASKIVLPPPDYSLRHFPHPSVGHLVLSIEVAGYKLVHIREKYSMPESVKKLC